jgi:uncharacterized protein (TIGR00369 family)
MSDIPAGFAPLGRRSPYIEAMGPFYVKAEGAARVIGFRVDEKHINTRGVAQGGFLASVADIALGYNLAFTVEPPLPLVTASLAIDFAGSARLGDWLEAHVDVQRIGRSVAFANCYICRGAERIVRASGVFARSEKAAKAGEGARPSG